MASASRNSLGLAVRYAFRELRGGLRGFYVFIACIALGVTAISGVGSVASSLRDGLAGEGRTLLGGDIAFSLMHRETDEAERSELERRGQISTVATLRSMVKGNDGAPALVELKAVDDIYPMLGTLALEPPMSAGDLFAKTGDAYGAAADATLMARMGLKAGDRVTMGSANFIIRAQIESEPDKLAGGVGLGPRFLTSIEALRASGMIQPGSLIRWTYRVKLADNADAQTVADDVTRLLPQAGLEVRTRDKASPQLERNIIRFTQFLTMVGLAALLVGGAGVANAVKGHIDRRRDVIATFKALGATGRDVFAIYLTQVLTLAVVGSAIGLVAGALLPFAIVAAFGKLLPLPVVPIVDPFTLGLSLLYGLLTALAFGLWPLIRVYEVPVAALFRDMVSQQPFRPKLRDIAIIVVVAAALIAAVVGLAYDKKIAAAFVGASIAIFIVLRGVAQLLMAIARRLPRARSTMLRLAVNNVYRPGALTPTVVVSLGLGLTVLVTITQIDGNLRNQFLSSLPEKAPSFFFIDIPTAESASFITFLKDRMPGSTVEDVPMLRGRITAARGLKAEDLNPSQDSEWVLQSDRGLSYTTEVPRGSIVTDGKWWAADYAGPPLVSMEKKLADGLGLKIGDTITVNVLGRSVTAEIANFRRLDWQSLGINFVLVYSPNTFRGAPHTHLATLTEGTSGSVAGDAQLVKEIADKFPMITSVRVREALEAVGKVVNNLTIAIRGASMITLLAAILVLGGALAAGHRHRVYDAVILKTLGATRMRLLGAYAIEYMLIGLATAIFAVAAGSIAAWGIITRSMNVSYVWQADSAGVVVLTSLILTVGLGLSGTFVALNRKPATVLRSL